MKSFIWRVLGVLILAAVSFYYIKEWIQVGWIVFLHHATFLVVFYLHERFWLHVDWNGIFGNMAMRSCMKCITYETILGNFILGIITLAITGSVQQMTYITLTYIGIKHAVFVVNEFVWKRIKWGME